MIPVAYSCPHCNYVNNFIEHLTEFTCSRCGTPVNVKSASQARDKGPSYYADQKVQPWDVVDAGPREQAIGYYRWSAVAYLMRMGTKDIAPPIQEVEKAIHYLEKLKEVLENGEKETPCT